MALNTLWLSSSTRMSKTSSGGRSTLPLRLTWRRRRPPREHQRTAQPCPQPYASTGLRRERKGHLTHEAFRLSDKHTRVLVDPLLCTVCTFILAVSAAFPHSRGARAVWHSTRKQPAAPVCYLSGLRCVTACRHRRPSKITASVVQEHCKEHLRASPSVEVPTLYFHLLFHK